MTSVEAKDTLREKHIEILQGIISRMAGNSFEVKKWSVGVVTALLGFSMEKGDWRFAVLSVFPALVFWYLDAFYLYQERLFRTLHERVRQATVLELEAHPYFLNPEFDAGATAYPGRRMRAFRRRKTCTRWVAGCAVSAALHGDHRGTCRRGCARQDEMSKLRFSSATGRRSRRRSRFAITSCSRCRTWASKFWWTV